MNFDPAVKTINKLLIEKRPDTEPLIQKRIEGCIRCYRFTGYLFKTLAYAGRGLRPMAAYSRDDSLYSGKN